MNYHFQNTAGRVIQVGRERTAYWAFIPNPLPPKLPLDWPLINVLSEAHRALGQLSSLEQSALACLLVRLFVRREAIFSSLIEGIQANITSLYTYETRQTLLSDMEEAHDMRVWEVLNYVNALEYGLERLNTLPVSLRLIRELHERLMTGVRGGQVTPGEFRRTQNWIGPPGCTLNEAVFVPPPVPQMHEALSALEKYLHSNDPYPPLIRLALIHYQFEAIHPFADGNGRVGRLLLTLLLVQWQLLPLPLLCLSAYFYRYRQEYYDLLLGISERGAWRDWVIFFLRGVAEQAQDDFTRAQFFQNLRKKWIGQLSRSRLSAWTLQLVDALFANPVLTISRVQKVLNVKYARAKSVTESLVQENILQPVSDVLIEGEEVYQASEIIEAVGNF